MFSQRFFKSVISSFAVLLAMALCWNAAIAGDALGRLRVVLVDSQDHSPVVFAEVDLYGARSLRGFTGPDGAVLFEGLPRGEYTIVSSNSDYERQILRAVSVRPGLTQSVAIYLTHRPSDFRVIAKVATKPRPPTNTLTATSPAVTLKQSLVSAISMLPDATSENSLLGSVSLDGHPASETGLSIEGVPVVPLGAAPNLQSFDADLFSAVGIDTGSAQPSSAGDIEFKMREPTVEWLGSVGKIMGSHNGAGFTLSEGGTAGRLGVAFSHGQRSQGDDMNGQTFLDTSGLTYSHDTVSKTAGDALKLRYPFSLNNVLTSTVASLNSAIPYVCRQYVGPVPCGYGPGNALRSHLTAEQIKDGMYFQRGDVEVALFHSSSGQTVDLSNYRVSGVLQPSVSYGNTSMNGLKIDSSYAISSRRSLSLHYLSSSQRVLSSGEAFGAILPPMANSLNYTQLFVSTDLLHTRNLSANIAAGRESTGMTAGDTASIGGAWRISNTDSVSLDGAVGRLGVPGGTYNSISSPQTLTFNCNDGYALGNGPVTSSAASTNSSLQASWMHQGMRFQSSVRLYRQVEHDGSVTGIVNAQALPSSLFGAGYFDDVANRFKALCGNDDALAANGLFFRLSAPADTVVYQGATALLQAQVSPNVVVNASYAATLAIPHGGVGPLFSPVSTVIAGRQLPSVPEHQLSLATAAGLGKGNVIAMASMHMVSSNNPNALPTYATFDAGLTASTRTGAWAATATNIFNRFPGPFQSDAGAIPLSFISGSFPTIAVPLPPRTFYIGYRFRIGAPDVAGQQNSFAGGAFLVRYYPLGSTPVSNLLKPNTQASSCGPEAVTVAKGALDFIAQYARDIDASRINEAYPRIMAPRVYDGLSLFYRRNGPGDYVILIGGATGADSNVDQNAARPLIACGITHFGSPAEFDQMHLYLPTYDDEQTAFLGYSPRVGLFRLPSLIPAIPHVTFSPKPQVPPNNPFELNVENAECTSNVHAAADALLSIISAYASQEFQGQDPVTPAELNIQTKRTAKARWLEITDRHSHILHDVSPCLRIAAISRRDLLDLGYGGLPWIQGLNYAPAFGLYVAK